MPDREAAAAKTTASSVKHQKDLEIARRALGGDEGAARVIATEHQEMLVCVLVARGVKRLEAEEVVADMISECFGARKSGESGRAILESYEGRSALSTWLVTVVMNRWRDAKRRDKYKGELPRFQDGSTETDPFEQLPDEPEATLLSEDLEDLMREALQSGFTSLEPEVLLMLKLIYQHQVSQEVIATMWQSNQSKISRTLSVAREQIKQATLAKIRERDPSLSLEWEDFVQLCHISEEPLF